MTVVRTQPARTARRHGTGFRSILLVVVVALLSALALSGAPAQAAPRTQSRTQPTAPAAAHTITYDKYSLMIDGQRTMIWSGEFEYWRLPSPSLWLDILQKMKAEGYNAVTIYFDWAYHSPAQGVYDFSGIRDVDRLLTMAEQTGLYVIARPGPYINGETTNGGLPAWLNNVAGKARTNAADYLAASDEWFHQIDAILKNHQLTDGNGSVILYQIENELASTGTGQYAYMQNLYDTARADGIDVPIFHNDKGRNGIWVPAGSGVPGTVQGPNDLYAFDGYPGGTCSTNATPGSPSTAPDWGLWGPGGATGGSTASPNTPGFAAEFGGGWFDYWGSNGTYDCTAVREGPGYERVFYGTNLANGLSIQNFYMTFGGTSWGWEPAPVVYSSYDYGAAISESRQLRAKASTMKELGLFLQSVTPVTHLDKGQLLNPSPTVKVYDDVNTETGTHFYFAMHNPSSATTNDDFTLPISTGDGTYSVPMAVNGQDAKILVADYDMDRQHLVYSTSEIMTHFQQGAEDLALLYGRDGEAGQTVLRYTSAPTVSVEAGSGSVARTYDPATGDLTLKYTHSGLKIVRITGGGRAPLTLLLSDTTTADTFWRQDTAAGPVLEQGPELVRTASVTGSTLALSGDTASATKVRVWAPSGVNAITWNGARTTVTPSSNASPFLKINLPGPAAVTLPDLSAATWRYSQGTPESDPGFDDSAWAVADHTTTTSTTPPPSGQVVLTADDYGFHQGDVWYRGRYTVPDGGAGPAAVTLRYGGGGAGMLQAWMDGVYLGQNVLASAVSSPPTTGAVTFALPAGRQAPGRARDLGDGPQQRPQRGRRGERRPEGGPGPDLGGLDGRLRRARRAGADLAHPGQHRRRGHRRPRPRRHEHRRPVRRAGRLVPARLPGLDLGRRHPAREQRGTGDVLVPHLVPVERAAHR